MNQGDKQKYAPFLVIMTLMGLASLALAYTVDVHIDHEAGVKAFLPHKAGPWIGTSLRYCQNLDCRKESLMTELKEVDTCPSCETELDRMSIGEKRILPPDTELFRKKYVHPDGQTIYASIVLSGKERVSIHRPERCLVGQGHDIVKIKELTVPLENRSALEIKILDLFSPRRNANRQTIHGRYFAYWFVGKDRETHSHYKRMFWMAYDRIFHNIAHQWAYIIVAGNRSTDYHQEITSFVQDLYPQMIED
ncbi:MAG: exosortase-associated EpsI family protein [Kiritimatiellae bacterium]|nr:exosortase-associated EpsI family protein [Kiritimatiellia bacterium]